MACIQSATLVAVDIQTFSTKAAAVEYCNNNISDGDAFAYMQMRSINDVIKAMQNIQPDNNIQSQINKNAMDEKIMSFNETQLKRAGFAEAFTPELQAKMEQRLPVMEHAFKKEFDGDKVDATLHLRKSASSDHYYLNKFDLNLQKEGQLSETKQTFYINHVKNVEGEGVKNNNSITLKEGYNLLSGRPVFKNLVNSEGKPYEAWVQLNLKNKLENGNHEMKQYTKNYGFDLENLLAKYPIKELTNEKYKESLVDSLQRGNLQKATFVGAEGKEEKLYISPIISINQLNIYDSEKQRIPTDKLIERQLVGQELAQDLKIKMTQEQKKPLVQQVIAGPDKQESKQPLSQKAIKIESGKKPKVKQKAG